MTSSVSVPAGLFPEEKRDFKFCIIMIVNNLVIFQSSSFIACDQLFLFRCKFIVELCNLFCCIVTCE